MLEPQSIAVVGASNDESKRGYRTISNLLAAGYDGDVFAVNPKYDEPILGIDVYPSVTAIPEHVDLAFVATPASIVPSVLRDCIEAEVAGAVVIAAGFDEIGNEALEAELTDVLAGSDLRLVGPNIQGLIDTHGGVDLLGGYDVPAGDVGLLTQSGNIGVDLAEQARERGSVGFSYNIGLGNELDVRCHEYLPILHDDSHTEVVAAYIEGLSQGRAFLREAKALVPDLPVVVFKGGKSRIGRQSVTSHTASLAGSSAANRAAYRQAGIITVDRSDALLPTAEALANLPPADGPRVCVLSDGGGHATVAADALTDRGLELPELRSETADDIRSLVGTAPNVRNPVDIMGQGTDLMTFARCAERLVDDPSVDALLVTGAFGGYSTYDYLEDGEAELEAARALVDVVEASNTSIVVHSYYHDSPTLEYLRSSPITVCHSVETACECLRGLVDYGTARAEIEETSDFVLGDQTERRRTSEPESPNAEEGSHRQLSEHASKELLAEYDVPFAPSSLACSAEEATEHAASFDGPVAMKVSSPDIVHSSDADCVVLDVAPSDAGVEYDRLVANARRFDPEATLDGVLVSPMVDADLELIVGATTDPEVGPVLAFGVGGVFVEVLDDVAFRAVPVTNHDAREMLGDIRATELLSGARGRQAVDEDALVSFVRRVSDLVANEPVAELDLNPVVAIDDRVMALDASIELASRRR